MPKEYCFILSGSWGENANRNRLESLAHELVQRGHQVVIILDHKKVDLVNPSQNPSFYTWPSYRPTKLKDALFLSKLIKKYKPDCMISQFGSVNLMLLLGWLFRVPLRLARYETRSSAVDIDSTYSKSKLEFLRFRKRFLFKLSTHLLANSESAKDDLHKIFQINHGQIRVFLNYLPDPLSLNTTPTDRKPLSLVCVGAFKMVKGQDVLIKALSLLPPELNLEVEFVGQGENFQHCKSLAESLGVESRCQFLGGVNHDQVFGHFARASASVVPSLDEAFGYVCIESLAVGTPVLGSRVGGIPEIVRDNVDGFLFTPGNPEDLAQKIEFFFSAGNDQEMMRENARQRFVSTFEQKAVLNDQVNWLLTELETR